MGHKNKIPDIFVKETSKKKRKLMQYLRKNKQTKSSINKYKTIWITNSYWDIEKRNNQSTFNYGEKQNLKKIKHNICPETGHLFVLQHFLNIPLRQGQKISRICLKTVMFFFRRILNKVISIYHSFMFYTCSIFHVNTRLPVNLDLFLLPWEKKEHS